MDTTARIDKFLCPFGGQEVELQQVNYEAGGMAVLRLRIRERKRFTIFEIDPGTAARWGEAMTNWARSQNQEPSSGNG